MKFGIVIFPGSNCDMDMVYVLETIMKQEVVKLWHKDTDLQEVNFIIREKGKQALSKRKVFKEPNTEKAF